MWLKKMNDKSQIHSRGFTLIELLVVIVDHRHPGGHIAASLGCGKTECQGP